MIVCRFVPIQPEGDSLSVIDQITFHTVDNFGVFRTRFFECGAGVGKRLNDSVIGDRERRQVPSNSRFDNFRYIADSVTGTHLRMAMEFRAPDRRGIAPHRRRGCLAYPQNIRVEIVGELPVKTDLRLYPDVLSLFQQSLYFFVLFRL